MKNLIVFIVAFIIMVVLPSSIINNWRVNKYDYIDLKTKKEKTDSLNLVLLEAINKSSCVIYHDWMDSIILINVVYYPESNRNDADLVVGSVYPYKEVNTKIERLNSAYIIVETVWPKPIDGSTRYQFVLRNKKTAETIGFPSYRYDSGNGKKILSEGKVYMHTIRINKEFN